MPSQSAVVETPNSVSFPASTQRGVSIHLYRAAPNPYRGEGDDMAISLRFEVDLNSSQAWIGSATARALAAELVRQCDAYDDEQAAIRQVDREIVF